MKLTAKQVDLVKQVRDHFITSFKQQPSNFFQSCGRLEIIGNHQDYNGGKVINSSAGNLNIYAATNKRKDSLIVIKSIGYPDLTVDVNDIGFKKEEEETSVGLIKGILTRFKSLGYVLGGFNAVLVSSIIKGGGVSSSASYGVLICKIISYYYNKDSIPVLDMCTSSRWSENNYFGKGSGLQDQIGCCSKEFAITDYYDQNKPIVSNFHVDLGDYVLMLIDTKTDHSESQGGFQSLVIDMAHVAKLFGKEYLVDVPDELFYKEYEKNKTDRAFNRAYHFKTELIRVNAAYDCLIKGDMKGFLKLFNESGLSSEYNLRSILPEGVKTNNLYECLHLGRKVLHDGAIRVHGGGFGGCCLVFVNKNEKEDFIKAMSSKFARDQFIDVTINDDPLREVRKEEII
jgi:galactokinase